MKLTIDDFNNYSIFELLKKINDHGYQAFIVGGAVRDIILKKNISDFDVATNANPEIVKSIFSNYKIREYGSKFGSVGVVFKEIYVEITTYRKENNYLDNRRPEEVEFVDDLYTDLSRRDFTINSLAFNPYYNDGEIVDYFGGINDINNKIVRTINNPYERFEEDGLRILRALRFSSTLGFDIEENTNDALKKCYKFCLKTSVERRAIELNKIINGDFFNKLSKNHKHILKSFLNIFKRENSIERYSLLYQKCGNPVEKFSVLYYLNRELLKSESSKLCINKKDVSMCIKIFDIIDNVNFCDEVDIRLKTNLYKKENIKIAYKIKMLILGNNIDELFISKVFENICYFDDLVVSKKDVINLVNNKKYIKFVLDSVLEKVIKGEVKNSKHSILNYIQNEINIDKIN